MAHSYLPIEIEQDAYDGISEGDEIEINVDLKMKLKTSLKIKPTK